ncbi:MAG: 23S rRNA (uracil(1939)-C(5))-methyltransferase RlmD [Clostridia bacterium]|nr:23S rRNA (uracil(1939)-C(5))-methyltransferase RlmD [Clostridia bacterium]
MRKNDILTLTADTLGADMEGVCRHEGMAVFVPGLLPGETAPVRIVKVQSRYAFGRLEEPPQTASATRRTPDCPVYPRCGGCSCRHMSYAATLSAKRQQVEDCFRRIGHLDVTVPPVLGMDDPSAYRNKTALPVGGTTEEPCVGFFAPRSHAIIPIDRCPNAMPPADDICRTVLDWMKRNRVAPYHEETHSGLVRHIVIRVNRQHQAMVTLVVNGSSIPRATELADALVPLGVVSLILNENRERTNVILGRKFRTLHGESTLKDVLCGLTFDLSPAAFFQVNPRQTEVLYQTALDFAELRPTDRLCDVYCGAGTISLMMARHCQTVLGIEIVPQAIDNAKENALRNGIANTDFRCGAAEDVLPKLVDEGLRPDVIVIDPPRKGVEPAVIDAIVKAAPRRVVYVSCNVATQARDAALLAEGGYRLDKVQAVDMFCWTSGVECVAAFSKNATTT